MGTSLRRRTILGYAIFGAFWGTWGGVLPAVRTEAGVSDGQLGLALVLVGVGALATMRLTGAVIDRHGGLVLPIVAVGFGVVCAGPGLARGVVGLSIALFLLGAASGAMDVAISATGVAAETITGRPLMNLANAAFSAAVVLTSLGAGLARAGGANATRVLVAVAVVVVVASALLLRPLPGERGPFHPGQRRAPASDRWHRPPTPLLILGGLGVLSFLVENAWQSWGAVHLQSTLGASAGVAAVAPATFAACAVLGRLGGNHLLERAPAVWLLSTGALIAAGGSTLAALAPGAALALVGIAVAGLGTSVCTPTLLSTAGAWAGPVGQAGATSTVVSLAYLGFLVGPALVGLIAGASTLPTALLVIAALALALSLLAGPALRRVNRQPAGGTGPVVPSV